MSTRVVRVAEIAQLNPRGPRGVPADTPVSFVSMTDLNAATGSTSMGERRLYGETAKLYTQFRRNDLLVAKITPCFENGKIGQAEIEYELGSGSTEFHVIRPDVEYVDTRYLLRFLRQPFVRVAGKQRMTGSGGQRRVPEGFLRDLCVLLPSLAQQRSIARVLDLVDTLRARRRAAITVLDDLTQSIFLDMFGDPVTNSHEWPMKNIGDLIDSATYGTSVKASLDGDIPVLRMNNITSTGDVSLSDLKYMNKSRLDERYLVHGGDILFNRTNSADLVGKSAIYRGERELAYAGYLVRLRTNDRNHPEYLAAFLNTRYIKRVLRNMCKSIVGMANINARELQKISVAEPPLALQRKFASRVQAVEALKRRHQAHLAELDALFASVQDRAFRGELSLAEVPSGL